MLDKIILIRVSHILTSIILGESRLIKIYCDYYKRVLRPFFRDMSAVERKKERKIESVFYTSPSAINYNQRLH